MKRWRVLKTPSPAECIRIEERDELVERKDARGKNFMINKTTNKCKIRRDKNRGEG